GFASSVFGFAAFRFLLGIGEGFNWPGASKTVAEWFPSQETSPAVAIFDSGSSVGGAVAALAIPLIALAFGWRSAFLFSGALGFIWLAVWVRVYHPLDRHPRVTAEEVTLIRAGQDAPSTSAERGVQRWLTLARNRNVWGIVLGRALTDPSGGSMSSGFRNISVMHADSACIASLFLRGCLLSPPISATSPEAGFQATAFA